MSVSILVTLAGVIEDKRFRLPAPELTCFGTFDLDDRLRTAVMLGCDVFTGGVASVTSRIIAQNSKRLSAYMNQLDKALLWSLTIAMQALKFMPVHDANGRPTYSVPPPSSLSAMLAEFRLDNIRLDAVDTDVHAQCACGRFFDDFLCDNDWTMCDVCQLWFCSECVSVHDCSSELTPPAPARLQLFDKVVDDAFTRSSTPLPFVHNLLSECLVPIVVNPALVEFSSPESLRSYLESQVRTIG